MKKTILFLLVVYLFVMPVSAMEITAPPAPNSAREHMPESSGNFGDDLWYIIKSASKELYPNLIEAVEICVSLIAIIILISLLHSFANTTTQIVTLVGTLCIGILLLSPSDSLISFGIQTITELEEYGKLLFPVMTTALAAEGSITTSAALYAGTIAFNTVLSAVITAVIVPLIYIFIALSIASSVIDESSLKKIKDFIKWIMTWSLKISIYLFTGYLGITGVVSGTADAAAIKATKLAFNGFVPVVGSIISDASETVLVSAGLMKNAAGIYGLLVFLTVWITPFIRIGSHYFVLKLTTAASAAIGSKATVSLIEDFSVVMGFLLAMTGTVCLLHMISTVCFMRGFSV